MSVSVGDFCAVEDVSDDAVFISDEREVRHMKKSHLPEDAAGYDSFFMVLDASGAGYMAVYGMHGIVPYLNREVCRVLWHPPRR